VHRAGFAATCLKAWQISQARVIRKQVWQIVRLK
jgi:hypothetical protein